MLNRLTHLPRESRDTLFLLLVILWVLLPQLPRVPLWCAVLAVCVLFGRALLAVNQRALPGRWWLLGLLALATLATLASHRTLLGRDAGVTMVVVLLTLKTLELRARRDAFVVFFLAFFAMLTNFFFSQSLPTAAAMLIGLMGLLTALVQAHKPVGPAPLRESVRTAAFMAALGAPIMALLFMLFPRLAPLWGLPSDSQSARSGLSAQMELGHIARLVLDDGIALRVRFDTTVPDTALLYFRGPVLSAFDGSVWRALPGLRSGRDAADLVQTAGPALAYEVTQEPNNLRWLLALELTPTAPQLRAQEPRVDAELQWTTERPITELIRYRVQSYPNYRYGAALGTAQLAPYRDLPSGFNPRTQVLARSLLSALPARAPAADRVAAALEHLRTGGYQYTLEPGSYGRDGIDEFWFDRKAGFCEHIAASFVVLLRAMDVPARVVTGYQGGERNPVDGYWTVRQSDAHAWTEVWLEARGWVRVDPTGMVAPARLGSTQRLQAPRGVFAQALLGTVNPAWGSGLRALWDAVNNQWNQTILNYTQTRQLDLLRQLGFESPSWEDLLYLLIAAVVLAALGAALWTLWERHRQDPWLRLLGQAAQGLQRWGIDLPPQCPPRAMAQALLGHAGKVALAQTPNPSPAVATVWADWLLRLEKWRYGQGASSSGLADLRREFRQLPRV